MKIEDIEGASVFVGRPISRLRARAGESVIATVAVLGLSAIHDGGVDPGGFEQVSVSTEVPAGSLSQGGGRRSSHSRALGHAVWWALTRRVPSSPTAAR